MAKAIWSKATTKHERVLRIAMLFGQTMRVALLVSRSLRRARNGAQARKGQSFEACFKVGLVTDRQMVSRQSPRSGEQSKRSVVHAPRSASSAALLRKKAERTAHPKLGS
jgi:hypothetical protein